MQHFYRKRDVTWISEEYKEATLLSTMCLYLTGFSKRSARLRRWTCLTPASLCCKLYHYGLVWYRCASSKHAADNNLTSIQSKVRPVAYLPVCQAVGVKHWTSLFCRSTTRSDLHSSHTHNHYVLSKRRSQSTWPLKCASHWSHQATK